jgi:hypothetical protein
MRPDAARVRIPAHRIPYPQAMFTRDEIRLTSLSSCAG